MSRFQFKPQDTILLVIDIQERLHQAMEEASKTAYIKNSGILIRTAQAFNIPIVISELYPRGLGPTIPEIRTLLGETRVHEKMAFSCWADAPIRAAIEACARSAVLVIGRVRAHGQGPRDGPSGHGLGRGRGLFHGIDRLHAAGAGRHA